MTAMIQGSPEWHQYRLGKVTASRVADIVAKTKSGFSTSRANYLAEKLQERLTGQPYPTFVTPDMEWGTKWETTAREAFEFESGYKVEQIGFVDHPSIDMAGASPDGLIPKENSLVEIKCPRTATHIETLRSERVPAKYLTQMHWQAACTGCTNGVFVSFDPRMPADLQLFMQLVPLTEGVIRDLEDEVRRFIAELLAVEAELLAKYRRAA